MRDQKRRRQFNEVFQAELERLNTAQRSAVEQIEGPVLVIAGPGTGKTQILATRIGHILSETDTQTHNILCLTFTDAGVQAMRRRLIDLIGPEAYRIPVFTFHSFCNSIIQNNIERFGRYGLEPVSDLERIEVIRQILDENESDHPLKRNRQDAYFFEKHLKDLFERMKSENWSSIYVNSQIDKYLDSLPEREEFRYKVNRGAFRKGDIKQSQLDEEKEKMERLRAGANLYPRFHELMSEYRRYDYDDMILWVIRAFEEHPSLLQRYQEQFLYFLVDEFQDTNGAQYEVLKKLIGYWENPNVFIVGDDDQSIYEFQGARLMNLINFYETYREHLELVVLTDNYRSSQLILDTSGSLIGHNEIRIARRLQQLGVEKKLTARNTDFSDSETRPQILEFPDRLHEETFIASQLENLLKEGFPLDEVAVVFARHKQATRLIELLSKKGIPFRTKRTVNVLHLPVIQNLIKILEYLKAEHEAPYSGEHWFFQILHFNFFGILPHDIARLAIGFQRQHGDKRKHEFWSDALREHSFIKAAGAEHPDSIKKLSNFLEYMLSEQANLSVPAMVERIINRSGLLKFTLESEDKGAQLQALFTFSNFVKKEADRDPLISLKRLLDIIRKMNDNSLSLQMMSNDTTQESQDRESGKVNLLTAHSSKGLEFQKVFIFDCTEDNWEKSKGGNYNRFSFPGTLTYASEEDAEEARRRLFFVAMTRSKEYLQLSYAASGDDGKNLQRSVFIDEIRTGNYPDGDLEISQQKASNAEIAESQTLLLLETKPFADVFEQEAIDEILSDFTLSVSSLNQYLKCPLNFYYEYILKVPVVSSEAASYGSALHDALKRGFNSAHVSEKKEFPGPETFAGYFESEMKRRRGSFHPSIFTHKLELGKQHMYEYCNQNRSSWRPNFIVEQKFSNVEIDGVPITGVIDRIDFKSPGEAHLVDYKSGSLNKSNLRRPSSLETNPKRKSNEDYEHGGSYWRQLVFYKILYEEWQNNQRKVKSAEISYLKPDAKGTFPSETLVFSSDDTLFMKSLIRETYAKIMRREFQEGCGEPRCTWCSFLKNQGQVNSFAEEDIEGLDD